jgi:hypothetical protein
MAGQAANLSDVHKELPLPRMIQGVWAFVLCFLIFGCSLSSRITPAHARFEVHIPSYQEEAHYLWRVLGMGLFRDHV